MFNNCIDCGSKNIITEEIEKTYYFRRDLIAIKINKVTCLSCGYSYILDTKNQIIRKVNKAYAKKYNLYTKNEIRRIRVNSSLSMKDFGKVIGIDSEKILSFERGYAPTIEENRKIEEFIKGCEKICY